MSSDDEIVRRSLDVQRRASDVPLIRIPGYLEWARHRLAEGESEAVMAHLDATSMWLLREEIDSVPVEDFDELLADLKDSLGEFD